MRSVSTSMMRDAQCTIERTQLARIEEDGTDSVRDRWFNPWRITVTQQAEDLIQQVITELYEYERRYEVRRRRRRQADKRTFEMTVSAIVSDVSRHYVMGLPNDIAVSRSKRHLSKKSRYQSPVYNKILPGVLDSLAGDEMKVITQDLGHCGLFSQAKRTTINAGSWLIQRLKDEGIDSSHFGVAPGQEVIHLKRPKEGHGDDGELIEYDDTPETIAFREQVQIINEWLQSAEIDFDDCYSPEGRSLDPFDRHMRRVFTQGRFDSGGRMFGGFWQSLRKKHRLESILIDGEDVIELDFGQMAPRLLYGLCGEQPSIQDLYDIEGYKWHRKGLKTIMNAMMFATEPFIRMPRGVRKEFDTRHSIRSVMEAIELAHPAIKGSFFKGIGHDLQFMESQILVDVLLILRDLGIVALPIHDAVIVGKSKKDVVKEVMLDCFFKHSGVQGVVSEVGQ